MRFESKLYDSLNIYLRIEGKVVAGMSTLFPILRKMRFLSFLQRKPAFMCDILSEIWEIKQSLNIANGWMREN